MAQIKYQSISRDPYIDGLLYGYKWGSPYVSVGFPQSKAQYDRTDAEVSTFKPLTPGQVSSVRKTLDNYDDVSGLNFMDMGTGAASVAATVKYGGSDMPKTAYAHLPSTQNRGGDVWYGNNNGFVADPLPGGYTHHTAMHETGHALGLMHPHERRMPADRDALPYTVMSHKSYPGQAPTSDFTVGSGSYPQTIMQEDVRAIQHMYGANYNTNKNDTTYRWDPDTGEMYVNGASTGKPMVNKVFRTVWDGGGNDTYDAANYTVPVRVDLTPGGWSTLAPNQVADLGAGRKPPGSVANAYMYNNNKASLIENAIGGSGDDTFIPNAADNRIDGNTGFDTVRYAGNKAAFTIKKVADNVWTVYSPATGTDTLHNIEMLIFNDGQVALT